LAEFAAESARQLAELVVAGGGSEPGYLLFNPLSFTRTASVELPALVTPPAVGGPVQFVQWDTNRKQVTLEVPGSGFVWLPLTSPSAPAAKPSKDSGTPLAEANVLRNEFFEVYLNAQTGGIGQIKGYGRSPNRLSHQLAFRFPRERAIPRSDADAPEVKSAYSQMRLTSSEVTCSGPALGEIVNSGEIIDQTNDRRLAGFRQTFRVWRGRPIVEVEIELDIVQQPDGDPWSNYFATRFAWNDGTAALTRSVMMGAQGIKEQRFESPHYLEIANESQRTTILNLGLPFHRKTGDRMVDTILVTAGETKHKFRFVIAIDQNYPLQAALDALTPLTVVPTASGQPRAGQSGWFFHLNARSVQITRLLGLLGEPPEHRDAWDRYDHPQITTGRGFALRLIETEGRPVRVQLRCFKAPTSARQRNFDGRTLTDLTVAGDTVTIDFTAYEIADVELRFD
jgi:alpha-mannosidase